MSNYLSKIFGASPVKPLQAHMAKADECAKRLPDFFAAVFAEDWEAATRVRAEISQLEHDADDLKKELRLQMPKNLLMPVARADLLSVLRVQDEVANLTKDIAGVIIGRRMRFPEGLKQSYLGLLQRCVDAASQAHKTVNELDELFEVGFSGKEVEVVQGFITTLDKIENDTDKLEIDVRAVLFGLEKELNPVEVMFLYKVIDLTGGLADTCQRVGSRLQLLLAR